jgi:hypothetical protein
MADDNSQETWVNLTEAAEITGYHRTYLKRLMLEIWKQPADQRRIRLKKRSSGYDVWLPDLLAYMQERGPYGKRKKALD